MNEFETTWTKKELCAYTLLYCANADYSESPEELEMIRSKVDKEQYKSIHQEFENDNDYQGIQKIEAAIDRLGYSKKEINNLISEMKALFLADGDYDETEKIVFVGLKKILKIS
jgi:Holliday junction resolvasome RuvABC DNA-binding subunit